LKTRTNVTAVIIFEKQLGKLLPGPSQGTQTGSYTALNFFLLH